MMKYVFVLYVLVICEFLSFLVFRTSRMCYCYVIFIV